MRTWGEEKDLGCFLPTFLAGTWIRRRLESYLAFLYFVDLWWNLEEREVAQSLSRVILGLGKDRLGDRERRELLISIVEIPKNRMRLSDSPFDGRKGVRSSFETLFYIPSKKKRQEEKQGEGK